MQFEYENVFVLKGIIGYSIKIRPNYPNTFLSEDSKNNGLDCVVAVRDHKNRKVGVGQSCSGTLKIHNAKLWWPYLSAPKGEAPAYLYTLEVYLTSTNESFEGDIYRLKFGIRTAQVEKDTFLINKKPFYFRGFGRHEDYNVIINGIKFSELWFYDAHNSFDSLTFISLGEEELTMSCWSKIII